MVNGALNYAVSGPSPSFINHWDGQHQGYWFYMKENLLVAAGWRWSFALYFRWLCGWSENMKSTQSPTSHRWISFSKVCFKKKRWRMKNLFTWFQHQRKRISKSQNLIVSRRIFAKGCRSMPKFSFEKVESTNGLLTNPRLTISKLILVALQWNGIISLLLSKTRITGTIRSHLPYLHLVETEFT